MILSDNHIKALKLLSETCPLGENIPYDFTKMLKRIGGLKEDADLLLQELHSLDYIEYVPFNSANLGRVTLLPSALPHIV